LVTERSGETTVLPNGTGLEQSVTSGTLGNDVLQQVNGEMVSNQAQTDATVLTQASENATQNNINQAITNQASDVLLQMLENSDEAQNSNLLNNTLNAVAQNETVLTDGQEQAQTINQGMDTTLVSVLGDKELADLAKQLQNIGVPDSTLQAFADGTLTSKEALNEISKALMQLPEESKESASHQIFSEKGFQNLIKNALTEQWLLKPDDVQEKGKVDALYERLNAHLSKLSEALAGKVGQDNPLAQNVSNLQNNLDFMNQLNQMYAYVQLPLKMTEGRAHGDLYVYANKKSLASKDGSVSALLHLDMEHLGPVDVYVAMQAQRVNTQFYLPDEEMLDFIEKHIHILNERLEKKGYAMNTVMSVKGEEKTAVEEILESGKNRTTLSHYSFDVRA